MKNSGTRLLTDRMTISSSSPQLGTPLDPSKLSRDFMRPAFKRASIEKPFRPWYDLRHTALTH
jgi:hypothetical protein